MKRGKDRELTYRDFVSVLWAVLAGSGIAASHGFSSGWSVFGGAFALVTLVAVFRRFLF